MNSIDLKVNHSGLVTLAKIQDERDGNLIIANASKEIPFEIKRVYYINQLENSVSIRGKHAHKKCEQVIFCISGSFLLGLDDGKVQQKILMNKDNIGIYLGPMLWHTMEEFSAGCVLLVFASDYYDESDYIRSYEEFTELSK
ncbi:FdtA/QdtA family cupin domain-containing protein [Leptospira sp. 201903075]|uniref:sugar 3,4-ketoisomerase n=1 Tax=Leptospira chreensis TaxID=2810035 RepID=UPI0019666026|nr:FdtA/QdtA family cupin domain-containing protein [Leptospira chreensis]MBM9590254.1 FdtA/QdtA family cupin domain-containing protein [Leptospira chreensis]